LLIDLQGVIIQPADGKDCFVFLGFSIDKIFPKLGKLQTLLHGIVDCLRSHCLSPIGPRACASAAGAQTGSAPSVSLLCGALVNSRFTAQAERASGAKCCPFRFDASSDAK
jgi:hypothetical protein